MNEVNIGPSCHGGGATQNNYYSVTVKKLVISGGPGSYNIDLKFGPLQNIKSFLGMGPSKEAFEFWVRTAMLGQDEKQAVKEIVANEQTKMQT